MEKKIFETIRVHANPHEWFAELFNITRVSAEYVELHL